MNEITLNTISLGEIELNTIQLMVGQVEDSGVFTLGQSLLGGSDVLA